MAASGRRAPHRSTTAPRSSVDGAINQSEATLEPSVLDDEDLDALEPPSCSFRDAGEIRSHIRRLVELRQRQREAQDRAIRAQTLVHEASVECLILRVPVDMIQT